MYRRKAIPMRLIVVSDTHRNFGRLHKVVQRHINHCDLFLHLGDGLREMDDILSLYPSLPALAVCGNCDWAREEPYERVLSLNEHKAFLCHGHQYGVKASWQPLAKHARELGCTLALFGHTHQRISHYEDGLYLLNPGSLGQPREGAPSYAVVDLVGKTAVINLVEV